MDLLQQTSVPGVSGILLTVAILWGIWPVACGVIGAMRGQTVQGIIHGFLWGPIGILIVLLSGRKYECPTCGKKTLTQPYEMMCPTGRPIPPPRMPGIDGRTLGDEPAASTPDDSARLARPVLRAVPHAETPVASRYADSALNPDTNIPIPDPAAEQCDEKEVEKLRAWVNAD